MNPHRIATAIAARPRQRGLSLVELLVGLFLGLLIIGVREVFWVTTRRAALVVLTPQLLLLGVLLLLAFLGLAIFAVVAQLDWAATDLLFPDEL